MSMPGALSLAALMAVIAFGVCAWGCGSAVLRACCLDERGVAFPAAIGVAALAATGGWLNLLHIAYPPLLWALLLFGWGAAAARIRRDCAQWKMPARDELVPGAVIAIIAAFLALTLLPSAVFNPEDDLQQYFVRPVRMLQTGTLGGDPFDALGFDSFGAQAFLQAFTLLGFPPLFLNAFDAVFCATLTLALVASVARNAGAGLPVTLAALAVAALLHPQQISISAMYSIAALTLALVPAAERLASSGNLWRRTVPLALLLAALPGLKASTASSIVALGVLFLAGFIRAQGLRTAARVSGASALMTALFALPWVGLHAKHYYGLLEAPSSGLPEVAGGASRLLQGGELYWGATIGGYNVVALFCLVAGAAGIARYWRREAEPRMLMMTAVCLAAAATYVPNAMIYGVENALRYSVPGLIVGASAGVVLAARVFPIPALALAIVFPACMTFLFGAAAMQRIHNAAALHTAVSFSDDGVMAEYVVWANGPEARVLLRGAQAYTAPGERILAMVSYPQHLFFARNPVFVPSEFGLTAGWLALPLDADGPRMRQFLRARGVRYVIWQIGKGRIKDEALYDLAAYPVDRRSARYMLSFRKSLRELASTTTVVHRDDAFVVMDLAPSAARAANL